MTRTVRQIRRTGRRQPMAPVAWTTVPEVDTRIALIQARIPVGLEAFHAELHCRTRSALRTVTSVERVKKVLGLV